MKWKSAEKFLSKWPANMISVKKRILDLESLIYILEIQKKDYDLWKWL